MSWEQYRIFEKAANLRSLRSAGAALGISQAKVIRYINALEKRVNAPLFTRDAGGVTLTDYGLILYDKVESMKKIAEQAESDFSDLMSLKNTLRVSTTTGLAGSWLSQIIPEFATEHPGINLEIIGYDESFDKREVASDIAIYPNYRKHTWKKTELLMTCHSRLFASTDYIAKNGLVKSQDDMKNHTFISYGEEKYRPYRNIDWYVKMSEKPAHYIFNNSYGASYLASQGLGIISWPTPIPFHRETDLQPVAPHIKGPEIEIFAGYNEASGKSHLIKKLISFIQKIVRSYA